MSTPVALLGASGHAKVIIEILEESREFAIAGCLCPDAQMQDLLGYPILGSDEMLPVLFERGVRHAFVAVGDNRLRRKLLVVVRALGFQPINAISTRATVSPRAILGWGVAIMPGVVVNVDTVIEDGTILNTVATVDHDCRIGACAHVAPGSNLAGNVTLGEGVFLGTGSHVVPGVSIGEWTVVGAGATVICDLPDRVTAVGVPARVIKKNSKPYPHA